LPAIIYASFAAALLVARSISSDRYTIVGCLCAATLVCSACPRREHMAGVLRFDFAPSPRLAALLATRDQVLALQKRGNTVLGGWGWWVPRDLEYVLPASGNFVDLSTWTRHSKSEDVLLIRNEFFNWDHIESLERLREICDKHMVFSRDPFVISECTDFGRPATPGHD
jgi:hypothetical protein